jgi:RNA polymerase sigma-70 factor (ECF subfamily)
MGADVDHTLLTELYTKYGARVYGRCLSLLRDREEARDAMHDVFIKVHKNLDGFRGDASPLTWMTRIATNHCLNVIRAKRAPWHARYQREVENTPPVEGKSLHEQQQLLRVALVKVAPEVAELAIYYFVDEMKQADICALVGISAPTLRKRLREFIEVARTELGAAIPGLVFEEAPL